MYGAEYKSQHQQHQLYMRNQLIHQHIVIKNAVAKLRRNGPPSSLLRPIIQLINFGYAGRAIELVTIPIINLFLLSNSLCGHNLSQALEARCLQPCRIISLVM